MGSSFYFCDNKNGFVVMSVILNEVFCYSEISVLRVEMVLFLLSSVNFSIFLLLFSFFLVLV